MDIKSANIVLDKEYNARLTDFGQARDIGETSVADTLEPVAKTCAYRPTWATEQELSIDLDVFAFCMGK